MTDHLGLSEQRAREVLRHRAFGFYLGFIAGFGAAVLLVRIAFL